MNVYVYVHLYICIYIYAYESICICTLIHMYIYKCICVRIPLYMCIYVNTYVYTSMYLYACVLVYQYSYVCTYIPLKRNPLKPSFLTTLIKQSSDDEYSNLLSACISILTRSIGLTKKLVTNPTQKRYGMNLKVLKYKNK
jgi:hypothetical protein